jgi:hypothetical protein
MSDIYLQITETPAVVTLSAPVISGALSSTVTVANVVSVNVVTMPAITVQAASVTTVIGTVTVGNSVTISSLPAISGTVTVSSLPALAAGTAQIGSVTASNLASALAVYGGGNSDISVNIKSVGGQAFGQGQTWIPVSISEGSLPTGTNRIGVVTIGGGTVTIGAGTSQIGSVTISSLPAISGTVTANISTAIVQVVSSIQDGDGTTFGVDRDFPISGTVGIGSSIPAGTAQIGSVTASISNTVVTIYSAQGTTVTNSNFTSTTASTTLVSAVTGRDVLTVFNEGAGNLFISPGATCTTVAYQVRLSAGDYWECPAGQLSLAHTAVFATAGTARVTQVS